MPAEVVPATAKNIERAVQLIRAGAVVAYPTETCYGLAVRATDEAALQAVFRVKGRSTRRVVSVLVSDERMVNGLVEETPPLARVLIESYWPGPLTIVFLARVGLPIGLINDHGGVGIRMSTDPVAQALVQAAGEPLTATSANWSGEASASRATNAALDGVALVLDGGLRDDPPSTVIDLVGEPRVVRQGPVVLSTEQIAAMAEACTSDER